MRKLELQSTCSKTETAPTEAVKKEGSVDGDEKVAAMKVESDEV